MMKYLGGILGGMVLANVIVVAEPSVYNNRASFMSPQQAISKNRKRLITLQNRLLQQNEQIDGLKSIVEGLSATLHGLQQQLADQNRQAKNQDNGTLLQDLGKMIDKINEQYVSKEELQLALNAKPSHAIVNNDEIEKAFQGKSKIIQKISKNKAQKPQKRYTSKKPSGLYRKGVKAYMHKEFNEAKKYFTQTDEKGYKVAASNFYLGEISYYSKQYENAVFYYKKSAGLDDTVSYIDTLLLHAAISLEKSGNKKQAKLFYENIIENYKGKKTAKIATKQLKKL